MIVELHFPAQFEANLHFKTVSLSYQTVFKETFSEKNAYLACAIGKSTCSCIAPCQILM